MVFNSGVRAVEEKVSLVPGPTAPVLVTARAGLAEKGAVRQLPNLMVHLQGRHVPGIPRSQGPSKKPPARAKISEGFKAKSKGEGTAVPEADKTFKIV